jgi:Tol biopolymer transport system component
VRGLPAQTPRWSPDGREIAYVADDRFGGEIRMVHPDGSNDRRFSPGGELFDTGSTGRRDRTG